MNIILDQTMSEYWDANLDLTEVKDIYRLQLGKNKIYYADIEEAIKTKSCDERLFDLINKYLHRKKMKLEKAKSRLLIK